VKRQLSLAECLAVSSLSLEETCADSLMGDATFIPSGPGFSVNDMEAMSVAVRSGAGIGLLAGFAAIDDLRVGQLTRVLPDYFTEERNVYAVYSSRQFIDAKITCSEIQAIPRQSDDS